MVNVKNGIFAVISAVLAGFCLFFSACDVPLGMGDPVDLEAPSLSITGIVLPDGSEIILEERDNKLFVGPGILVGPGFHIKGTAQDNLLVTEILVEEIDHDTFWNNAVIGNRDENGIHEWSIRLEGIQEGERNLRITALDNAGNIGSENVKQLTLLIDVDPPIIDSIKIERQPGLSVDLLPKANLAAMYEKDDLGNVILDSISFDNIDYFQNESFTIRASISHKFTLDSVKLNLLNEDGDELFAEGLAMTDGALYTPVWVINHNLLTHEDYRYKTGSQYNSGLHIFTVVITAKATAGHTNDIIENQAYNLCWYPESDNARIRLDNIDTDKVYSGGIIPVRIFDDDNIDALHIKLIPLIEWEDQFGETDDEKLEYFTTNPNYYLGGNQLLNAPVRSTVLPFTVKESRGRYKMAVIVRDYKQTVHGIWSCKVFDINVIEEGIPIIKIDSPQENTSPSLLGNGSTSFEIKGSVINLEEINFLRVAWVSAKIGSGSQSQINAGENALKNNAPVNGIKIMSVALEPAVNTSFGEKDYKEQKFTLTYDVLDYFKYGTANENDVKLFIFYTQVTSGSETVDVFHNFRLMPNNQTPKINVISPISWQDVAPSETIHFNINVTSDKGIPIQSVKLSLDNDNGGETVIQEAAGSAIIVNQSHTEKKQYHYIIIARDVLGNTEREDVYIIVTDLPELVSITSPHTNGSIFSSDDDHIIIQAVFSGTVNTVNTNAGLHVPKMIINGFNNGERTADYHSGAETTTLSFRYKVQPGDKTGINGIGYVRIENNGADISAYTDNKYITADNKIPATKTIHADGVLPVIESVSFTGYGDTVFSPWLKSGETLEIRLTANKNIRVTGSPALLIPFGSTNRTANFENILNDRTMVFTYKVQTGDLVNPVTLNIANCLDNKDRIGITDTVSGKGNPLSLSGAPSTSGIVRIDAVKPAPLAVIDDNPLDTGTKHYKVDTANKESNSSVEYTTDGFNWHSMVSPYQIPAITDPGNYRIGARQIDLAGNYSDPIFIPLEIGGTSELVDIKCTKPDGAYPFNESLIFRLIFNGRVKRASTGSVSVTLQGGSAAGTDVLDKTITMTLEASGDDDSGFSFAGTWLITEGIIMNPVKIKDVVITGVTTTDGKHVQISNQSKADIINDYNNERGALKVLSVRPRITNIVNTETALAANNANNMVLAAENVSGKEISVLKIKFSHQVWAENGKIIIKPNGNWHIPPVLTSDEYVAVTNALTALGQSGTTHLTNINNQYKASTHGLLKNGSGQYTGTPDTNTKYVLNYALGIDGTSAAVVNLRNAFNAAKFNWQEIDVTSPSPTITIVNEILTVQLERLKDGRQWKIEFEGPSGNMDGAYRDEAGNTFAGWGASNNYWFWSEKTAEPVIRVNRISNNISLDSQNTTANANVAPYAMALATKVQYRIDCETPDAVIYYNTWNRGGFTGTEEQIAALPIQERRGQGKGVAIVTPNMTQTDNTYRALSYDGPQNSIIEDATSGELAAIVITQNAQNTFTANTTTTAIGDDSLYTARKDYITAAASRTNLSGSVRGYEGAFKTVVIYRNIDFMENTADLVKYEATTTRNGAVTIAGFPMNYNNLTGISSRYAYRSPQTGNTNGNIDWVWISWEIVSEFWQVGMRIPGGRVWPGGLEGDPWASFNEDHFQHSYRKYGNWGLRVGNNIGRNPQ